MNYRKPDPLVGQPSRAICPVCGKTAYSRGGVHPQCGLTRADAELKAVQRAAASTAAQAPTENGDSVPQPAKLPWRSLQKPSSK